MNKYQVEWMWGCLWRFNWTCWHIVTPQTGDRVNPPLNMGVFHLYHIIIQAWVMLTYSLLLFDAHYRALIKSSPPVSVGWTLASAFFLRSYKNLSSTDCGFQNKHKWVHMPEVKLKEMQNIQKSFEKFCQWEVCITQRVSSNAFWRFQRDQCRQVWETTPVLVQAHDDFKLCWNLIFVPCHMWNAFNCWLWFKMECMFLSSQEPKRRVNL